MATSYINNMQTNSVQQVASYKSLKKARRGIPTPFQLKLYEEEELLYCDKIVRIIPGKRIVAFGTWKGQPVVAKLFYEPGKAKKHIQRDSQGIEHLTSVNIPTPKLLLQTKDSSRKIHILIFERILDSVSLDWLWQEKSDIEELTTLMHAVTLELATQHVLGIVQNDLHLKNFLVTKKQIYTLDGGSIQKFDHLLPKRESLEHLGLFFSQLGAGTEELQQDLFNHYAESRSWIVRPPDVEILKNAIKNWRVLRTTRYQKKIMRNCTAFSRIKKLNAIIMLDHDYQTDEFAQFIKNPDAYFNFTDTEIIKAGRSATVAKIKIDKQILVVKRYNMKNVGHWLRRCLRPTRAQKSWQLAHQLWLEGIPTAKPIAFIEKNFLGLRNKSYFVMPYIEGKHIGDYFSHYDAEDPKFIKVAKRTLNLFRNLAKLHLTHGDLKMSNIIIHHDRPVLIDLDGMREHTSERQLNNAYKNEIRRFMENWDAYPEVKSLFEELL